mmetsp:Transcript_7972/g.10961  ORF Transcript_7972/g.10961 Transcript_7972/m.10961 type:complete len:236 (+) Transcript_7972:111-818(+)|eukprot:CAMPEP_0185258434 /NCGR_PEP_ID=MMETSP1359-20130426/7354_1 /TAXON_ID=552665 /ORGANISM="Bigelowiella longifila, Strain CCMP242" /LENGTH=235 /DNA_ID=CAMNT_0027843927 /DNA_START=43 /DNA_END=750 /DNA_ORIENTATION=+
MPRSGGAAQQTRIVREIVNHLKKTRGSLSFNEIKQMFKVDLNSNSDLLVKLRNHRRLDNERGGGNTFMYNPEISQVGNKEQLQNKIQCTWPGIEREHLEDAFIGAKEALQDLIDEKKVLVISNKKSANIKSEIVFPISTSIFTVDQDIKEMWGKVKIPYKTETELEQALVRIGQISAKSVNQKNDARAKTRGLKRKVKKKQERRKKVKGPLTNEHMMKNVEYSSWMQAMTKGRRK